MADGLSQIAIEKLHKNNFQVWKFRIINFLMGKGYHEKTRKVLYWFFMSVSDSMIVHIQDAKSPKQAWDILVKMYSTNT
jgi:hypothetical protein